MVARPRSTDPSSSWSFWLPDSLIAEIERIAALQGRSRNAVARDALESYKTMVSSVKLLQPEG